MEAADYIASGVNRGVAKIEVISWSAIAVSTVSGYNTCAICKNDFTQPCLNVEKNQKEKCTISWGECGHGYHTHCLEEWRKKQSTCPIDNQEWKMKRVE